MSKHQLKVGNSSIRSESGKLSTIMCHFPPKSTNFGTLILPVMNRATPASPAAEGRGRDMLA